MKTTSFRGWFTAAAFLLCTTVFANAASAAGFGVIIDCHGDGGYPTWSESNGPITIKAYINGAWVTVASNFSISNSQCTVEDGVYKTFPAFSWDIVDKIKISNGGTDGLFMDVVYLTDASGTKKIRWGVDNNIGYCLSTEKEGPETWAYCWNAQFYTSLNF